MMTDTQTIHSLADAQEAAENLGYKTQIVNTELIVQMGSQENPFMIAINFSEDGIGTMG